MVQVSGLRLSSAGLSLVLGEDHPLRRTFPRTFAVSATVAILLHVAAAGGRLVAMHLLQEEAIADAPRRVYRVDTFPSPLPICDVELLRGRNLAEQVTTPKTGDVVPVPDFEALLTLPTEEEMSEAMSTSLDSLVGKREAVLVGGTSLPSAEEYVAVEVQPVAISTPSPEYPAIARQAGIEGIVTLRVLVDDDGDVRDVIFVSGPEMLKDAAIAGVRLWKFRPALQQQHPVAVWVMVPMKFSLER
jgi:protein TonB